MVAKNDNTKELHDIGRLCLQSIGKHRYASKSHMKSLEMCRGEMELQSAYFCKELGFLLFALSSYLNFSVNSEPCPRLL